MVHPRMPPSLNLRIGYYSQNLPPSMHRSIQQSSKQVITQIEWKKNVVLIIEVSKTTKELKKIYL